ncbi:hypothetical protein PV518_31945 [Streptomyces sp. ND04-05B]|uniref:hypothetical protein n=1 Tax=Streptomyces sp. ND04-05B TaxID=3028693 RepID=UPI0029AF58BB|nr:hypothetical protein [Streptomyces sp. ND04-05B]MDX3066737.1 hypothetical protein [Streptomyces sp. ND04-05B]
MKSTVKFKALVTEATAVLLTRGLEVEPVAVREVVAHVVEVLAQRTGMNAEEAVHLVTSETVADAIVRASDQTLEGAEAVRAVRPVRVDARTVSAAVRALRRLVMAVAHAGKYASLNGDGCAAAQAMDLATEFGAALAADRVGEETEVPVGLLDELAQVVESVARKVEVEGWSICPCGRVHEQEDVDVKVGAGHAHGCRAGPSTARPGGLVADVSQ